MGYAFADWLENNALSVADARPTICVYNDEHIHKLFSPERIYDGRQRRKIRAKSEENLRLLNFSDIFHLKNYPSYLIPSNNDDNDNE